MEEMAEFFWDEFQETICNNSELQENWYNSKIFTNLILEKLESILKKQRDDVFTEREYFRIDLISYRNKAKNGEKYIHGKLKKYSWDLEAAVEHENDSRAWMDEVIKLAHISCDLRVVIGYLPKKHNNDHEEYLKQINDELWNNIAAWKHTKDSGDFLIIIGDSSVNNKSARCQYTAYRYIGKKEEQGCFEKMD